MRACVVVVVVVVVNASISDGLDEKPDLFDEVLPKNGALFPNSLVIPA